MPTVYRDLITLSWLTGPDGRPSYWKLTHLGLFVVYCGVMFRLMFRGALSGDPSTTLWPMLWWTALLLAGGFGIKGLQMWFNKAQMNTIAQLQSTVTMDVAKVIEARKGQQYEETP